MKNFNEISNEITILKELENICEMVSAKKQSELDQIWYKIIKPVVVQNVGFSSSNPKYNSSEWYDCVYHHLSKILEV